MIYVFLADGFEECEAIAPIDILRRGGIEVKTVGIGKSQITGSHSITVNCDLTENEIDLKKIDGIILPGGMPGTLNLDGSDTVQRVLKYTYENGLLIGAICAAPLILGRKGYLKGKKATCFTGFENELIGANVINSPVVCDGNIITAYGAGAAFEFGFALLNTIKGEEFTKNLRKQMRY